MSNKTKFIRFGYEKPIELMINVIKKQKDGYIVYGEPFYVDYGNGSGLYFVTMKIEKEMI